MVKHAVPDTVGPGPALHNLHAVIASTSKSGVPLHEGSTQCRYMQSRMFAGKMKEQCGRCGRDAVTLEATSQLVLSFLATAASRQTFACLLKHIFVACWNKSSMEMSAPGLAA